MLLGVAPTFVLDTPEVELPIVQAVLNRATELRLEYDEHFAQAIGAETAARVVPPLAKHTTALIKALARAMS